MNVALVANHENIPFIHETYPGNVHDSVEFPTLIDGIVNRLTDLKINNEDITLVFDKGNNSDKNIGKLTCKLLRAGSPERLWLSRLAVEKVF